MNQQISRFDRNGKEIKQGAKDYHITFKDQIPAPNFDGYHKNMLMPIVCEDLTEKRKMCSQDMQEDMLTQQHSEVNFDILNEDKTVSGSTSISSIRFSFGRDNDYVINQSLHDIILVKSYKKYNREPIANDSSCCCSIF